MEKDEFSVNTFAEKIGATADKVRDWRRRGISLGGAAINGRVSYTEYDVFTAKIMLHLHRAMFELGDAWRITEHVAPWLAKAIGKELPSFAEATAAKSFSGSYPKFALVTFGSNVELTDDAADLMKSGCLVTAVVRLDVLASVVAGSK